MKLNLKAVAKAIVILILLTVLPLVGQRWIPSEFYRALSLQGGFDLADLINRIAVVGVIFAVLVALRGHVKKGSSKHLALSTVWKIFWLFIVFFVLGIGHPETLGLAILGGKAGGAENIVTFDFRLFAILATAIVVLMIARSILQFRETKSSALSRETESKPNAPPELSAPV
ncbi:MAG TPA: hypothetical protein VJ574_06090 [Candidatus Bathyarchaeia archaeon]|nr:hypothetical protein [Candidatus Bathyarchaeia archaeon]